MTLSVEDLLVDDPSVPFVARPAVTIGASPPFRSVESLIGPPSTDKDGPAWPIGGMSGAGFDENAFARAVVTSKVVPLFTVSIERHLMALDNGGFVAAAYRVTRSESPSRSLWYAAVQALDTGTLERTELLRQLLDSEAARSRGAVVFHDRHLRRFVEATGVGLQDVAALVSGLVKRQVRRRSGMVAARIARILPFLSSGVRH